MLNKNKERELAYLVKVDAITPMNADRLECAHIGGWHCVVGKDEFKVGDPAIYFEIDSQLPDVEPFSSMEFLRSKKFKIKTQKIRGEYSQGLLVSLNAFIDSSGTIPHWLAEINLLLASCGDEIYESEARFLTKQIGVTYATSEDNFRKSNGIDKYKKMAQRHPKVFSHKFVRWLMRREWGKKLLFVFFGKSKDKKSDWPTWVVKTDEERIQNCGFMLNLDTKWIATEKIDGSSTTFTLRKKEFLVCSRNVVFNSPDKNDKCYYDTNIYTEMAEKYNMKEIMKAMLSREKAKNKDVEFITIQAETYGSGVQKRNYGLEPRTLTSIPPKHDSGHCMAIFNIIIGYKDGTTTRLNPIDGKKYADFYGLPFVPVVSEEMELPKTIEEVVAMADGESEIDGGMREGLVFRSIDGTQSFKAVSNEFLIKYHG